MLEEIQVESTQQETSPLPPLDASTSTRMASGEATPITTLGKETKTKSYRVRSIRQMLELFNEKIPVVFLGGQMGTLDENGNKTKATDRLALQQFCETNNIHYYDPDESTPQTPTFDVIRDTDKAGLLISLIDVICIGHESAGVISALELLYGSYLGLGTQIIYFTDANNKDSVRFIPFAAARKKAAIEGQESYFTDSGNKISPEEYYFQDGSLYLERIPLETRRRLFDDAIKVANLLRSEVINYLRQASKLSSLQEAETIPGLVQVQSLEDLRVLQENPEFICYEISSTNLHLYELVKCFSEVLDGKKVAIYFHPPRNENNEPIMSDLTRGPDATTLAEKPVFNPSEEDLRRILKQYINGSEAIRQLILQKFTDAQGLSLNRDNTLVVYNDIQANDKLTGIIKQKYDSLKSQPKNYFVQ